MMPDEMTAIQNTDREIWREVEGDFYAPSIHVTAEGSIGINVAGHVIIKPVRNWHLQDARIAELEAENRRLREALGMYADPMQWGYLDDSGCAKGHGHYVDACFLGPELARAALGGEGRG